MNNKTLGITLGLGSCGWGLIESNKVVGLGVRMFDIPETSKERTPKNQLRRQYRGMRRVIRRKRQRMSAIRALFAESSLAAPASNPWALRAAGLDRLLSEPELAVALCHIAKHRGFQSNSKRDRGANAPNESSEMLRAIATTVERLAGWRTVGEMFAKDPEFASRKRNRGGDYSRSVLRDDLRNEVRLLFTRQRQLGAQIATAELESQFTDLAFYQRPLGDSEDKVEFCRFERTEKRAAKCSYSFELFRLLSKLNNLRVRQGRIVRSLSADELALVTDDFGAQQSLSFSRLRKVLKLDKADGFEGIDLRDERDRDVVTRSGAMVPGSYALRNLIGDAAWRGTKAETLDAIAAVCSFREDTNSIRAGLEALNLDSALLSTLMEGVVHGTFAKFSGVGHISAKACRNLIPYLAEGMVYSAACTQAGYDHTKQVETSIESVTNPIARKAFLQAVKQVKTIIEIYGLPDHIHISLARDVGKSIDERREIEARIEKRNVFKDWLRKKYCEDTGRESASGGDLLRYELWREQLGRCIYTDQAIPLDWLDSRTQVSHILPWSRSGDDSYNNKAICLASVHKGSQTPFEWFTAQGLDWSAFSARIEANKVMRGFKKRNYLLKDASTLEEKFRERNLNDTRYASRLLLNDLASLYPEDVRRHIFARPGALTDRLRRGWGLQEYKKVDGKRVDDDRYRALDAVILAATDQRTVQMITRAFQETEIMGVPRDFGRLEPPWPTFRNDVLAKYEGVFISRAERRRARGAAHAATVRQVDGETVYQRKAIEQLSQSDLTHVKDADRNAALVNSLRDWIAAGKPKDALPRSPKGDVISKVRLKTQDKVNVLVRGGSADRGDMARVDVFIQMNKYYLVPIYPHQIATMTSPPSRLVKAGKNEADWPEAEATHEYIWSLYPLSYIEATKADGTVVEGYFRGLDRATGAIALSPHYSLQVKPERLGVRTLLDFRKFTVDRLGNRFEIKREKRTWHGVVCI